MNEQALQFGENRNLVGILAGTGKASKSNDRPVIIILNSGVIHRVGPNRMSVKIGREIGRLGYKSFRFDFSGIGDSTSIGDHYEITERWLQETQRAMDVIEKTTGHNKFILLGNCSGALFSFLTAKIDNRVVGAVLINFPGHKTVMRYYAKLALLNPKWWLRLFSGTVNYQLVLWQMKNIIVKRSDRSNTIQFDLETIVQTFQSFQDRGIALLMVYSEWDAGLSYYNAYLKSKILFDDNGKNRWMIKIISGIDHEFSLLRAQEELIETVRDWLK